MKTDWNTYISPKTMYADDFLREETYFVWVTTTKKLIIFKLVFFHIPRQVIEIKLQIEAIIIDFS